MKTNEEVRDRIAALQEERSQLEDGVESYGDSDIDEVDKIDCRVEELLWILGIENEDALKGDRR